MIGSVTLASQCQLPFRILQLADSVGVALAGRHDLLIEPLVEKMATQARAERFEEAARTRDRLGALTDALRRHQRFDTIRSADRLIVRDRDGVAVELRRGLLTRIWVPPPGNIDDRLPGTVIAGRDVEAVPPDPGSPGDGPLAIEQADELAWVASWLERHASDLRVERVEGTWATPVRPIPTFSGSTPR